GCDGSNAIKQMSLLRHPVERLILSAAGHSESTRLHLHTLSIGWQCMEMNEALFSLENDTDIESP
ncbi:hypothetical protein KUCAC02_011872, partial [Chaenocephalus aceratus]